jgi:Family of unknown function (DUF6338)
MPIPSSVPQLIILVAFILPGIVYQAVRSRLRGPTPDELNATSKVLRAATVSTALVLVYAAVLGRELVNVTYGRGWLAEHPRVTAGIGLILLLAVPVGLAIGEQWLTLRRWRPTWLTFKALSTYDPTPAAWDFAFRDRPACFIRVLTDEGRWVGGWFDPESFASSFPQTRELYIAQQWKMGDDGAFEQEVTNSRGVYVRCDDARVVEFVAPVAVVEAGTIGDDGGEPAGAEGMQGASDGR